MNDDQLLQDQKAAQALPPGQARRTAKRLAGMLISQDDFTPAEQSKRWGVRVVPALTAPPNLA